MSVFRSILSKIFGGNAASAQQAPAGAPPVPGTTAGAAPGAAPTMPGAAPTFGASPAPGVAPQGAPAQNVDVAAVLTDLASKNSQQLNWKQSIVDLMKLLDLDSGLENRKDLAKELGYTGDMNDSASMNVWLHKQVMRKLAENGGVVPADLKD